MKNEFKINIYFNEDGHSLEELLKEIFEEKLKEYFDKKLLEIDTKK